MLSAVLHLESPPRSASALTHSVNKELGLGWEVVVDDIVQEGNINAPGLNMVMKQTNRK